jgi:hypothetical protein
VASAAAAAASAAFLAFYYSLINYSFLTFSSSIYRYRFPSMSRFCCANIYDLSAWDSTFFGEGSGLGADYIVTAARGSDWATCIFYCLAY